MANGLNDNSKVWKGCAQHAAHEERLRMLEEAQRSDSASYKELKGCISTKLEKKFFYSILTLLVGALLSFGGLSLHNTDKVSEKVDVLSEKITCLTIELKIMQERMVSQNERMRKLERSVGKSLMSGK